MYVYVYIYNIYSLYLDVSRQILKCMYGPSRENGSRHCFWAAKIPRTNASRSRHSRDSRVTCCSPRCTQMLHGPLTFRILHSRMPHDSPVRSLETERASHWTIMRHTAVQYPETHRPTMHQSAQWGAPNSQKRDPVPGTWCIYGGYFWEPNARSGTFSSYVV